MTKTPPPTTTSRAPVLRLKKPPKKAPKASAPSSTTVEPATNGSPRPVDVARRTLAQLGQQVKNSERPAPQVPVEERAGKTAALRADGGKAARVFAAIDLGSSSVKMLVLRVSGTKTTTLLDEKIGCALGKGVQNGQPIPEANQARALEALRTLVAHAAEHGVDPADIPLITTAVVRNSTNGAVFVDAIRALGLKQAKVLDGDDEAQIGYLGALGALGKRPPGRYATLDLGGGSFQLAVGDERKMEQGASTQLGSNLILDTLLAPHARPDGSDDPLRFADVDRELERLAPMPLPKAALAGRTLVATGGVSKFLRQHFHKDVVTAAEIDALRRQVLALPYQARVELVQSGKTDDVKLALGVDSHDGAVEYGKKLPASSSLLLHILRSLGVDEVRVSETDARHALIKNLASGSVHEAIGISSWLR